MCHLGNIVAVFLSVQISKETREFSSQLVCDFDVCSNDLQYPGLKGTMRLSIQYAFVNS